MDDAFYGVAKLVNCPMGHHLDQGFIGGGDPCAIHHVQREGKVQDSLIFLQFVGYHGDRGDFELDWWVVLDIKPVNQFCLSSLINCCTSSQSWVIACRARADC